MASPTGANLQPYPVPMNPSGAPPTYAAAPGYPMATSSGTYGGVPSYPAQTTYVPGGTYGGVPSYPVQATYVPASSNALPTFYGTPNDTSRLAPAVGSYGTNQQQPPTEKIMARDARSDMRMGFVRKVYGILSAQLLLTVLIAMPFSFLRPSWIAGHTWVLFASLIALIACTCAMACCGQRLRKYPDNYIFLFVYTVIMALVVGFLSAMFTWQSVLLAAGVAVLTFLLLSCYARISKIDFTGFGPYFFAATCVLLLFGIVLCILSLCGAYIRWLTILYDMIGVILFSFYIIYDTQLMIGEHGGHKESFAIDDYAFAALKLYTDIVNMFMFLLSLFGRNR